MKLYRVCLAQRPSKTEDLLFSKTVEFNHVNYIVNLELYFVNLAVADETMREIVKKYSHLMPSQNFLVEEVEAYGSVDNDYLKAEVRGMKSNMTFLFGSDEYRKFVKEKKEDGSFENNQGPKFLKGTGLKLYKPVVSSMVNPSIMQNERLAQKFLDRIQSKGKVESVRVYTSSSKAIQEFTANALQI